jgi:hypothetical protein
MKKAILIGGGVLLVGGIAYLYFTNKKKTEALLSVGVAPSSESSTSATANATLNKINSEIKPLSALDTKITVEDVELEKAKEIVKKMLLNNVFQSRISSSAYKSKLKKLGYSYDENTQKLTKL